MKLRERPEMNGTQEQIECAESIKAEFKECREWRDRVMEAQEKGTRGYFLLLLTGVLVGHIERIEDSSWWLSNSSVLALSNFKSAAPRLALELLPEWAIKECIINSGWTPKRGEWKRILDRPAD